MKQISRSVASFSATAILIAGTAASMVQAKEWEVFTGAESANRESQALAFLPNELWIQAGDSIRWTFSTHERHTLTFLTPTQTRPAAFGPVFGVGIGCPGATPDGVSFDGSKCANSDLLLIDENTFSTVNAPTYSVTFPSTGNFKFVCLFHADMTGVVHVLNAHDLLPHDQGYYDRQAQSEMTMLLTEAARLKATDTLGAAGGVQNIAVAAGIGAILTTNGAGAKTASLMRFLRETIDVNVGDTVEWMNLDPSINHTVTFGTEPTDPRPVSTNVQPTSDGARQAVISSPTDNVNSGYLTPTPQDRSGLAEAAPGVTRFRVTFTTAGTYNYICAIHDELGMKGTVIVH